MKTLKELKENKEEITEKGPGLWANIRAKRQRIKSGSGERMRKPGEKGAPSPDALQKAKGTSEGMAEAAFKDPSPMMKDSIKQDKIRSLKNLIAIAKVKGVHHKVKELELELKKLQEVTEASKPRTPMRDFLRRYPVPKDQMAKPVKKEKKQDEKKVEEQHPEDEKTSANKLEPEGTKKWLAQHGKHLKYLKNLKKAPTYEETVQESDGPVVWKKGNTSIEKIGDEYALYIGDKKTKMFPTIDAAKASINEAEGSGTAVPAVQQAANAKKRAQLLVKSADLKMKQEKERQTLKRQRDALKSEEKVPEFKTGGKPLAKKFEKAMAAMGIKTKIKMRTVNNISMNELFTEAMKKDKEQAPSSKEKMKKGDALSGKKEPVEVTPEMNPTK